MSVKKQETESQPSGLNRRDLILGGATVAATVVLPQFSEGQQCSTGPTFCEQGAVYCDPTYKSTFNGVYTAANMPGIQTTIRNSTILFPDRCHLKWGDYQRLIAPDPTKWGQTAAKAKANFDKWPYHVASARTSLEKQPANFSSSNNVVNPYNISQAQANLQEHLDEAVRIAIWDLAVPINVSVTTRRARHHGLTTEWSPAPPWTPNTIPTNPSLTINMACPKGGWQGNASWRNPSPKISRITTFQATWTVPAAPNSQDQQIIFIFNGLESVSSGDDVGGILQPVLQWTKSDGWAIRNWYIRADFDPVTWCTLPPLNTQKLDGYNQPGTQDNRTYNLAVGEGTTAGYVKIGSVIKATITDITPSNDVTGKRKYNCTFSVDNVAHPECDLNTPDIPELINAVCAIESYDVSNVQTNYPANPIMMSIDALTTTYYSSGTSQNYAINPIDWMLSRTDIGLDFNTTQGGAGDTITFTLA